MDGVEDPASGEIQCRNDHSLFHLRKRACIASESARFIIKNVLFTKRGAKLETRVLGHVGQIPFANMRLHESMRYISTILMSFQIHSEFHHRELYWMTNESSSSKSTWNASKEARIDLNLLHITALIVYFRAERADETQGSKMCMGYLVSVSSVNDWPGSSCIT